jgi:hypothetical protein
LAFLSILFLGKNLDPQKALGAKRHAPGHERARAISIFTRVGTYAYVQRRSKFCFLVVLVVGTDTLIRILHFRPISPCILHHCMHPCLDRQPCPYSLALAALPLPLQPCSAALPKHYNFRSMNLVTLKV